MIVCVCLWSRMCAYICLCFVHDCVCVCMLGFVYVCGCLRMVAYCCLCLYVCACGCMCLGLFVHG